MRVSTFTKTARKFGMLMNSYRYHTDLTTKTGFPVTVWINIQPTDRGVGINSAYVDESEITTRKGWGCAWLKLSASEKEDLETSAYEAFLDEVKDNFNEPDYDDY